MSNLRDKAISLATRAINSPKLLEQLDNEIYETFILSLIPFSINLAQQLDILRPVTNPETKILFWEAAGILTSQKDYS
tara:strand:- start:588 stop:821 length:234 start_codon:yes stop_codon:yes gene_type:complete